MYEMPIKGNNVCLMCHFQLDWVFQAFDNAHCPLLQNKPKIFFIQACRGGKTLFISVPPIIFDTQNKK